MSLNYSKRQKKIHKYRIIRETPTLRPIKWVHWHKSNNWAKDFPVSSKEHRFRLVQIVHIKQPGTKFQISELCFPNQWYQQSNKSKIEPGMTQSIPNNRSIYIHKEWATGQKINGWSTGFFSTNNWSHLRIF